VWLILAVPVLLGVILVLAFVVARRGTPIPPENPDALFITGIAVTGSSAALIATMGAGAIPIFIFGIVCIGVGARRSRDPSRHR
jgi:hypothetical protein